MTKFEEAIGRELASFKTGDEIRAWASANQDLYEQNKELMNFDDCEFMMKMLEIGPKKAE